MSDPRLDGDHLDTGRWDQYHAAVAGILDARGPGTAAADRLIHRPLASGGPPQHPPVPPGGKYTLVSLSDGQRHPLRVGVNALGRARQNDLVLAPIYISRRHYLVLVHATGGCEVSDTASRHGTRLNNRPVDRAGVFPGDVLELCDQRFLVAWVGPDGQVLPALPAPDTSLVGGQGPMGL